MKLIIRFVLCSILIVIVSAQGPYGPTEEERKECEKPENKGENTFVKATKQKRLSCTVTCHYEDSQKTASTKDVNSPKGTKCCNSPVRGAPTGTCTGTDGKCKTGGA